jgi:hypothetical protein
VRSGLRRDGWGVTARERLDVEGEGFRTLVLAACALVASAGVAVLPGLAA